MRVTRMMWYAGTVLTTLAMLAASATAAAQQQARAGHARSARAPADTTPLERQRAANVKSFRGIAARLNTTPEALADAYERARRTNPKLSRGNFIAANVLADNLGARHPRRPNITTAAILSGLESGRSMGQTLQGLGLSAAEAKQARREANRQVKDEEKRVKEADKRARREQRNQRERERSPDHR